MKRQCIEPGCPGLTNRTRCAVHQQAWEAKRVAKRGNVYDATHRHAARDAIASQPWCSQCGATSDLVGDHLVAGRPEYGYQTLCRACNSAKANKARAKRSSLSFTKRGPLGR